MNPVVLTFAIVFAKERVYGMQYAGGKFRQSKQWAPIIQSVIGNRPYVEPFLGGGNMMMRIKAKNRIGADINPYLMQMWIALQEGWIPPKDVSEKFYAKVKANRDEYPCELVGFLGFGASFGAKWFNSYARNAQGKNYAAASSRVLLKQIKLMRDVQFVQSCFWFLEIPKNAVVYCDPPYKNAGGVYHFSSNKFDYERYYDHCRFLVKQGCVVFASEYSMPKDFELVHSMKLTTCLESRADKCGFQTDNLYLLS